MLKEITEGSLARKKEGGDMLDLDYVEMLEDLHEMRNEGRGLSVVICRTRFGPEVDHYSGGHMRSFRQVEWRGGVSLVQPSLAEVAKRTSAPAPGLQGSRGFVSLRHK